MLRKNQKGQGLVEFALILPILLMLLLGIIEGGRIIWAYITVQNAAREAARYAVTGRPFACAGDPDPDNPSQYLASLEPKNYCDDAAKGDPWSPQVLTSTRVVAIKNAAIEHGKNLNVGLFATGDLSDFNGNKNTPGAFGVAVIGQDGVNLGGLPNYGGQPGYNVRVETYYNVVMIDPIYDVIMGGQSIHLAGQVELQNEGTDPTSVGYSGGIAFQTDSCAPNCGSGSSPYITVQDEYGDFAEPQGGKFTVAVNDHQANAPYTVWFVHKDQAAHRYSLDFTTDNLGSRLLTFVISASAMPTPGLKDYKIYTTLRGSGAPVASCLGDIPTNSPCFEVTSGVKSIEARNITQNEHLQQPLVKAQWPISSSIPIYLYGHDTNTQYTIKFNGLTASAAPGGLLFNGSSTNVIPTDSQMGSNQGGNPAYYIATNHNPGDVRITSEDMSSLEVASTTIKIVQAYLDIAGETPTSLHPADDVVWITLQDHAPRQQYTVVLDDGITRPIVVRADDRGQLALNYVVPNVIMEPCADVPGPGCLAVPVDIYTLDYNRGDNPNKIAQRTISVFTPINPYLNVPGGARWPAGSPITIQVRRHAENARYRLYLEQGPVGSTSFRERINGATFTTGATGSYNMDYRIPTNYSGFYVIRSYAVDAGGNEAATATAAFSIEVTNNPYITIDNGNRWPPNTKITIRLGNHVPSLPYDLWLDKGGPAEKLLGTVTMDVFGGQTFNFTIPADMATRISPNYYPIQSYFNGKLVAETRLEVNRADLRVTNIQVPSKVEFDIEIPITITIANAQPVTITNTYFDADVYIDPKRNPVYGDRGLPPGDYKTWIRNVPPNGTVQYQEDVVLFGRKTHEIHARADTTDWVIEDNENNNFFNITVQAACQVEIEDKFQGALTGWTQTAYGNSSGTGTQTSSGGTLTLRNRGSSAFNNNDSSAGYHLMHRPVSGNFEVYLRVDSVPNSSNGFAGLEIRTSAVDSASDKLLFGVRGDNNLRSYRRSAGSTSLIGSQSLTSIPVWLKIVRNGDQFQLYQVRSTNTTPPTNWGSVWRTIEGVTMPQIVEVGIFHDPGSSSTTYNATFRNFHVCATSGLGLRCGQVEENGNGLVVFDAVNFVINQTVGGRKWQEIVLSNALGQTAIAGVQALPDSGGNVAAGAGPHATYQAKFTSGGTFYMWVAGRGVNTNGDSVHLGLNGAAVGTVSNLPATAGWVKMPGSVSVNAGINTINLWMAEDGAQVFRILLTQSAAFVPDPNGMAQSACTVITPPHVPPMLEVCSDPIKFGTFDGIFLEVDSAWNRSGLAGLPSPGYNGSMRSMSFPIRQAGFPQPTSYQTFAMPDLGPVGILTNTTAYLKLNRAATRNADGNRPNEHLYFDLRRASDGHPLISNVPLAHGGNRTTETPPVKNYVSTVNTLDMWDEFNQNIFAGQNPLSFLEAGDELAAYFYTNNGEASLSTTFYMDNLSLTFCSVQPLPQQQAGLGWLTGKTLSGGAPLRGVTVWAYADAADDGNPGPVFQTQSIQDGSYRFYNLPAGRYLIYAQITTTDGTLSANRRIEVYPNLETRNVMLNVQFGF